MFVYSMSWNNMYVLYVIFSDKEMQILCEWTILTLWKLFSFFHIYKSSVSSNVLRLSFIRVKKVLENAYGKKLILKNCTKKVCQKYFLRLEFWKIKEFFERFE